jgi:hypothetical protein
MNLDTLHRELEREQRRMTDPHAEYTVNTIPITDRVCNRIATHGPIDAVELASALDLTTQQVSSAVKRLVEHNRVTKSGVGRKMVYHIPSRQESKPKIEKVPVTAPPKPTPEPTPEPSNVVEFAPLADETCDPVLHHLNTIRAAASAMEFYLVADRPVPVPVDEQEWILGGLRDLCGFVNPDLAKPIDAAIKQLKIHFGGGHVPA